MGEEGEEGDGTRKGTGSRTRCRRSGIRGRIRGRKTGRSRPAMKKAARKVGSSRKRVERRLGHITGKPRCGVSTKPIGYIAIAERNITEQGYHPTCARHFILAGSMPERIGERGPVDHIVGKGLAAAFRELGFALVVAHRFLLNLTTAVTVVDRAYEPSTS